MTMAMATDVDDDDDDDEGDNAMATDFDDDDDGDKGDNISLQSQSRGWQRRLHIGEGDNTASCEAAVRREAEAAQEMRRDNQLA